MFLKFKYYSHRTTDATPQFTIAHTKNDNLQIKLYHASACKVHQISLFRGTWTCNSWLLISSCPCSPRIMIKEKPTSYLNVVDIMNWWLINRKSQMLKRTTTCCSLGLNSHHLMVDLYRRVMPFWRCLCLMPFWRWVSAWCPSGAVSAWRPSGVESLPDAWRTTTGAWILFMLALQPADVFPDETWNWFTHR
jgi:hypothetical protein